MRKFNRATIAAIAVAAGMSVTLVASATPTITTPAAAAVAQSASATYTCTTNTAGYCTVAHTAGVIPDAVLVTPLLPAITSVDQLTATTFRVRFVRAIAANGTVTPLTGLRSFYARVDWTPGQPSPSPSVSPIPSPSPSPDTSTSPSPSASPTPSPSPTAGDFPNATNTGVPDGVTLTTYTGPCTITVANTTIDSKNINCDLNIRAAGVTIIRSRIHGQIDTTEGTTAGLWLQDSEVINGKRAACQCVGSDHFVMLRVEVIGGNRGVYCRLDCTVQDSWIHGTDLQPMQHASAVRVEQHATIRHNTLACDWTAITDPQIGCSADLTGYPDFAPITHNTITGNLFVANPTGFGYCAYGGGTGGKPYSGDPANATFIVFTGNVFQRGSSNLCGAYGPVTDFIAGRAGSVWSGNVWDNGGTVNPA